MNFCPRCGLRLQERDVNGKPCPTCLGCGFIYYLDPKVAVGVVVGKGGAVLLTQRNHEPKLGEWSFPSGFVDRGERVEDAAAREVKEETGIDVRIDRLLGVFSEPDNAVIFIAYGGTMVDGELEIGPECLAVEFVPLDRLPDLAFPHDGEILRRWSQE